MKSEDGVPYDVVCALRGAPSSLCETDGSHDPTEVSGGDKSALSESFNANNLCSRVSSRKCQYYS